VWIAITRAPGPSVARVASAERVDLNGGQEVRPRLALALAGLRDAITSGSWADLELAVTRAEQVLGGAA